MNKGKNFSNGYATIGADGVNYRLIAEHMTSSGYKINHSSARNHIMRVMSKFVSAIAKQQKIQLSQNQIDNIAKSSQFQDAICDVITRETICKK